MAELLDVRSRYVGPGDNELGVAKPIDEAPDNAHPMDSQEARDELRRLLEWYYQERDRQADNRLEMAIDHDFYDGQQWDPSDAAEVESRGQMPLVYNEIAPMVDWLIGTERRMRIDWNVLPRAEDDVALADVKKQTLKYVSDINRTIFSRSRAFSDAVKGGVGWVDDGARDDPTQDILYSKYEDWRNVLWDSTGYELDLSDSRYLFRWRWVDEDVAMAMFKDRAEVVRAGIEDHGADWTDDQEDGTWYLGERLLSASSRIVAAGTGGIDVNARRRRVRLIECQYRKPVKTQFIDDGPLRGLPFNPHDQALAYHVQHHGYSLTERVAMRMHVAVFTEAAMISYGPSLYRHNSFSLTPLWCYRRSRDRMPYGVIRRVRDIQMDLNKRASKALFMLSTNQLIGERGATDDWNALRDEADRPDGNLILNNGKQIELRRDTDAATGQLQMMTLAAQSIQKTAGVNNENLGRQTNAVSGAAIEARQNQGAVGTTEPFDNHRLAVQLQGQKQLSLTEQFYSEAKVLRLTGTRGKIDWVRINQPEQQPDGSYRILNDVTASQADFIVAEQDYAGTLRQAMFDSLSQIVAKLPPEIGLRLYTIAMQFSDFPNKDDIVEAIRGETGQRDPNKELTPEEEAQAQQEASMQAEAMEMQREQAMLALDEQRAKVRELNAKAAEVESRSGGDQQISAAVDQVRGQLMAQIDQLSGELQRAQAELANRTMQVNRDADARDNQARIDADAKVRVAEIQSASDKQINAIGARIDEIARRAEEIAREAAKSMDTATPPPAPPPPTPPAPTVIHIQVDAKGEVKKSITVERDADGNITGAKVAEGTDNE